MNNIPLRLTRLPLPPTDEHSARALREANREPHVSAGVGIVAACAAVVIIAGVIIGALAAMVVSH